MNAHPHFTKDKRIVIVHNGIIENYQELRESLEKKGYEFISPDRYRGSRPSAGSLL